MNYLFLFLTYFSFVPTIHSFVFRDGIHRTKIVDRSTTSLQDMRKYPYSRGYYENYLRRLNSRNFTQQTEAILGQGLSEKTKEYLNELNETYYNMFKQHENTTSASEYNYNNRPSGVRIIIRGNSIMGIPINNMDDEGENEEEDKSNDNYETYSRKKAMKSENFEVITKFPLKFKDVGGYENIKTELQQCVDILSNYAKYNKYNVRVPKGLIFEGPPGNGKTLMAKALAGEAGVGFIAVSGAQFQEKYVGVGSSRVRELFELAKKHVPCIVFIDEIDALGKRRASDGETSNSERDNTLNELLVALDGFKNTSGVFVVGATNRVDMLDPALIRPGRIDKRIFIGNPDTSTRRAILNIHSKGKAFDETVVLEDLVELTSGLSGAQIENLVNEAMLTALRHNREYFNNTDIDTVMNKMMVGWQPNEHQFTTDIIDHIAIHEMGHAVVGLVSKHHSKISKVVINLSAPRSPAYTVFESATSNIYTREALFEHLMILLGGRIAEEVFYDVSVTTGAINDFEEALKLAEKMIVYYGMGKNVIYPVSSEKYKEMVDDEVVTLIKDAYAYSEFIIRNSKDFILETSEILKQEKILRAQLLHDLINDKYKHILNLKI